MLVSERVRAGGLAYYFADEPLVEGSGPAPGVFGGRGAEALGIAGGHVEQQVLEDLAVGRDPTTGEALGSPRRKTVAFDVVFPVAKSISLLFGLGDAAVRATVLSAHHRARDAALAHLESVGPLVGAPSSSPVRAVRSDGLCWAAFCHHTSRAGDPHLHSHVVVVNRARAGETWRALRYSWLLRELSATGWLYERALRAELTEQLGVGFRTRRFPASDVIGVSDRVIEEFSRRQAAITDGGTRTGASLGPLAARVNRPPKDAARGAELAADWARRAACLGVVVSRPPYLGRGSSRRPHDGEAHAADALRGAAAALGRPASANELIATALGATDVGLKVGEVERALSAVLGELVELDAPTRAAPRYATAEVAALLSRERGLLAGLTTGAGPRPGWTGDVGLLDPWNDPLGAFGALHGLALAALAEGRPVTALATSWRAASRFGATTGLDASLLGPTPLPERGVLVLADAHRVPVRTRLELVERALARDDSVVYCGHESLALRARPLGIVGLEPTAAAGHLEVVGGVEVEIVSTPSEAISALARRASDPAAPVRVLAGRVAAAIGIEPSTDPDLPLVVLGGRDLLPTGNWGARRTHVLVRPLALAEGAERAFAFGVAVPAAIRRLLGSPRPDVGSRTAWGQRALALERTPPRRGRARGRRVGRDPGAGRSRAD